MNEQKQQNNISDKKLSIAHKAVVKPMQTRYARLYHQRSLVLVSDLLIIIGIMVLFSALVFFWNHPITSNRYIDLSFSSGAEQVSGDQACYQVYWQNNNRNIVNDAYLSILAPKGFAINKVQANGFDYIESMHLIDMGDLLPGSNGELEICGLMWADLKLGADWEIRLYYKNLGIQHNKTLAQNISYSSSLLTGVIEAPNKVYLNNYFPIYLSIANNSKEILSNIQVGLHFPADFELRRPMFEIKDNTLFINELAPGQIYEIELTGKISYLNQAEAIFAIATDLMQYDELLRQDWQQVGSEFILPKVDLDLRVDDKEEFLLDKQYNANLYYYNYENFDLNNVEIKYYGSGQGLSVVFSPSDENFTIVKSEEENFLSTSFFINNTSGQIDGLLFLWADLSWLEKQDGENIRRYVFSQKKQVLVKPHLEASARLYYFTPSGDQIGYGPLPPVVGESTSYWVSIRLRPSFGEVKDLTLSTELSEIVKLIDYNTSLGSVKSGDNISWQIDAYDSGWQYKPQPRLNLHLEITPTLDSIEKNIILLRNIQASAYSLESDIDLSANIVELNNDMTNDLFWPNSGQVLAE